MCLAVAAVHEGIMPANNFPINYSAVDVICDTILQLSLNKDRKHSMYHYLCYLCLKFVWHIRYHIVSKEVHHWTVMWRWMNEVGYAVERISKLFPYYKQRLNDTFWGTDNEQAFLEAAKKIGSPLKHILPLLEMLREVWFQNTRPIDDPMILNGLPVSYIHLLLFIVVIYFCYNHWNKICIDCKYWRGLHKSHMAMCRARFCCKLQVDSPTGE